VSQLTDTVLISIISSGLVGGILKLILDRSLSHKFKRLEHDHIASLTEDFRIKAKVFDDRFSAHKELSCLIVVAFERGKSMIVFATKGWFRDFYSYAKGMYQIRKSLADIMSEHRAVLESEVIILCTEAIHAVESLADMYSPNEEQLPEYAQFDKEVLDQLNEYVQALEKVDSSLEAFGWSKTK